MNTNNLIGTIPIEIANLSALLSLILNDNLLSGSIPVELENLSDLQILYLHNNRLTNGVPAELGNLSALQYLYLNDNLFQGEIPPQIGNLLELVELTFNYNQFSGNIPLELGSLTKLVYLDFGGNELTGAIPVALGSLSNLETLYLNSNYLEGAVPDELATLTGLTTLVLNNNQFISLPDFSAASLNSAKGLQVQNNKIGFADIIANLQLVTDGKNFTFDPQVIEDTVRAEVANGATFEMSTAEATTGTAYQWYFNEAAISGATAATYSLTFDASSVGAYTCQMTNSQISDLTITRAPYLLNSTTAIIAFVLPEETGKASIGNGTVTIEVAKGTNVTSLTPAVTLSTDATVNPLSGVVQNFTDPVTYTVTAGDGTTTQEWVVTVTVSTKSAETLITSLEIAGVSGTIDNSTVTVEVPKDTEVRSLTPTITLSTGATVNPPSGVEQDFSDPVTYTVTAEDGMTTLDWIVTVTVSTELSSENAITAFSFLEETGTVTPGTGTIDIEVANGTDVSALVSTFTLSTGASATVNAVEQVSGTTPNDFTDPVTYTVTAEDGTTQNWIVTVTLEETNDPLFGTPVFGNSFNSDIVQSVEVVLDVTDIDGDLQEVIIYYRSATQSDTTFVRLAPNGDSYSFTFVTADFDDIGLGFYFEATDSYSTVFSQTFTISREFSAGKTSVTGLKASTEEIDYGIISVPFQQVAVGTILQLGGDNKELWRLYHYSSGSNRELTTSDDFEPGKGYWFLNTTATQISLGQGVSVEADVSTPFSMTLTKGQNQIGNPFPYSLDWNEVIAHNAKNGVIINQLIRWVSGSGYTEGTTVLNKFQGAFLSHGATESIEIPISAIVSTSGRVAQSEMKKTQNIGTPGQGDWKFGINLENDIMKYYVSAVGMNDGASIGEDPMDIKALPRLSGYLDMVFHTGNAQDMTSVEEQYKWSFEVQTNFFGEETTMSWDNFALQGQSEGLYLFDIELKKFIDMSSVSDYRFLPASGAYKFDLYFGSQAAVQSLISEEVNFIGNPYPNPSMGQFVVPIAINSNATDVVMEVRDLAGRSVYVQSTKGLNKGYHEITLDLANNDTIPTGTYIIDMNITSAGQTTVFRKKIIYAQQ